MNAANFAVPQVAVGHEGLRLSQVVAGAMRLADTGWNLLQRQHWIEQAVALGITTFDHADIYGGYTCEAMFGEVLAQVPGLRNRVQLVTKCGIQLVVGAHGGNRVKHYDSSAAHLRRSVENSLRALRTDRLDLLLVHRPDPLTAPAEVGACLQALRREGKVLHAGVSNHSTAQFTALQAHVPLATHQVECSPLQMAALADGTLDQCLAQGLRPMVWSPLGGGRLMTGADAQSTRLRAVLQALGREHGASPATMAYAWLLRHPAAVLPIVGSLRTEALREAAAALAIELPAQDWYAVWQASMGREVA
jgi:predicted oxidoreductase